MVQTVLTLQYYSIICIHSVVLQYKLYSLWGTMVQTIHSAVLDYKPYSLYSTTLQTLFTLQYCSTNYSLCSTRLQTIFTLQYYATNSIHSAVLQYKLYSFCSTRVQNCKSEIHIADLNIQSMRSSVPFQWPP